MPRQIAWNENTATAKLQFLQEAPAKVSPTMMCPSTVIRMLAMAYGTATPSTGVWLAATSHEPVTAASTVSQADYCASSIAK